MSINFGCSIRPEPPRHLTSGTARVIVYPLKSEYRNPAEQEKVFNAFISAVKSRLGDYSRLVTDIDKYSYPQDGHPGSWHRFIWLNGQIRQGDRFMSDQEIFEKGMPIIQSVAKEHFPRS